MPRANAPWVTYLSQGVGDQRNQRRYQENVCQTDKDQPM